MGEPIKLYAPDGDEVTVYGLAEAARLAAEGYTPTPPVKPAKPAKTDDVTEVATEAVTDDAPVKKVTRRKG